MVNKLRQKGVSLLEILVSLMLLCSVMMTFAMVFPSGYRLNLKNRMESKASKIANGIANKIQNVDFVGASVFGPVQDEPTIQNLQTWSSGDFHEWFEDDIPEPFYLPDNEDLKGIDVTILDPEIQGGTLARIRVTVAWEESIKGRILTKFVTVTTYRSRNH